MIRNQWWNLKLLMTGWTGKRRWPIKLLHRFHLQISHKLLHLQNLIIFKTISKTKLIRTVLIKQMWQILKYQYFFCLKQFVLTFLKIKMVCSANQWQDYEVLAKVIKQYCVQILKKYIYRCRCSRTCAN